MVQLGRRLILGNWKMHLNGQQAVALSSAVAKQSPTSDSDVTVAVFPPFTALQAVAQSCRSSHLLVGGQDCHGQAQGAFTGSISAGMLADAGAEMVILGHSERRQLLGETSQTVCEKAEAALKQGLHVILCLGETHAQREAGEYLSVIESQLKQSLPTGVTRENLSIAYEPVWAIGTGKNASALDINDMHAHIKTLLIPLIKGEIPRILYGGSVKANNALEILSLPVVDGVLVGGASLDASAFLSIVDAAKSTSKQASHAAAGKVSL